MIIRDWLKPQAPTKSQHEERAMARPNYLLRAVLALVGIAIIALGLNVGLGGILTLG